MDTKGIDDQAKRFRNMNKATNASTVIRLKTEVRDEEPERGISQSNTIKYEIARDEQDIIKKQLARKDLTEGFAIAEKMCARNNMSREVSQYWNEKLEEYGRALTPSIQQTISRPSHISSARNTPSTDNNIRSNVSTSGFATISQEAIITTNVHEQEDEEENVFYDENLVQLTHDSSDSEDDLSNSDPNRERAVPITAYRERIVREIREKEAAQKLLDEAEQKRHSTKSNNSLNELASQTPVNSSGANSKSRTRHEK